MDRLIVAAKLEALRRCVARVETRRGVSAEALKTDPDRQDIVSLNLTRAVQLCVDLATHVLARTEQPTPTTMGETFTLLAAEGLIEDGLAARLRAAVGFRNVAVHTYQRIDWEIVHRISHEGLDDFRAFAESIERSTAG